jgi:hypothetical protein
MRSKRKGDSKSGLGSLAMVPLYHGWFRKGPKPYQWYIGRCRTKLGQTGQFMESLEGSERLWCWSSMQITKYLCATQPRFPKDLSISNAVIVKNFGHVHSKTETTGLRSRTSVAVKDDVADLKVVKNLAQ